jgi:hypothetical protein
MVQNLTAGPLWATSRHPLGVYTFRERIGCREIALPGANRRRITDRGRDRRLQEGSMIIESAQAFEIPLPARVT